MWLDIVSGAFNEVILSKSLCILFNAGSVLVLGYVQNI